MTCKQCNSVLVLPSDPHQREEVQREFFRQGGLCEECQEQKKEFVLLGHLLMLCGLGLLSWGLLNGLFAVAVVAMVLVSYSLWKYDG